jgi:hypothetical protein
MQKKENFLAIQEASEKKKSVIFLSMIIVAILFPFFSLSFPSSLLLSIILMMIK